MRRIIEQLVIRIRLIALSLAAAVAIGGAGSAVATAGVPAKVVLAPPTIKPGHKCAKGVSGCSDGKFTGNFFGD